MAGECRIDRNLGGFVVTNLANHDLVGIMAENRPQSPRKRQALLLVDRNLRDPLQLVFDRILDGDDLVLDGLDLRERRVQRRGLAAAGRTRHQHHPVRFGDVLPEAAQLGLGEPEDVQPELGELLAERLLVQDADDRVFPVHAGHDRHAEVDRLARHPQLEATVLRHALLRDVEFGHHLDTREDRAMELLGDRAHRWLQHAVDAVFHVHGVVLRLDVNVARAPLNRRKDGGVNQANDRAEVAGQPLDGQVVLPALVLLEELQLKPLRRILQHSLRALALLENRLDRRPRPHGHFDRRRQQDANLVDHRQVGRIGHDDAERTPFAAVGHEAVAQHQIGRDRAEQILVDPERVHVHELEVVALGETPGVVELGDSFVGAELGRLGVKRCGDDVSH